MDMLGGRADVNYTHYESAIKEFVEESRYRVAVTSWSSSVIVLATPMKLVLFLLQNLLCLQFGWCWGQNNYRNFRILLV